MSHSPVMDECVDYVLDEFDAYVPLHRILYQIHRAGYEDVTLIAIRECLLLYIPPHRVSGSAYTSRTWPTSTECSTDLPLPTQGIKQLGLAFIHPRLGYFPPVRPLLGGINLLLENDLDNLKYLSNLEDFHMDQYFPDRCDDNPDLHSMTNVLESRTARQWM